MGVITNWHRDYGVSLSAEELRLIIDLIESIKVYQPMSFEYWKDLGLLEDKIKVMIKDK